MTNAFAKPSWRGNCRHPEALCARRRGRLVLLEPLGVLRDSLAYSISTHIPETTVESYSRLEDVAPGPANLLLVGVDPRRDGDAESLEGTIRALRDLCGDAPIGVVLARDDGALARRFGALGVAGVVQHDAGLEIAIAAIQLMWVGGFCLPPEPAGADHPAAAPAPRAAARALAPAPGAPEPGRKDIVCEHGLTSRECDVLRILREGRQNKLIAFELGISESTVKVHLRNMMKKLRASNRTQVALGANLEG
jgi:DNA-binding NarL/FixJ family response regulator